MAAQFQKVDAVREYIAKFPDLPNQALAKVICKENPTLFPNVNSARQSIQRARGKHGERHRKTTTHTELFKEAAPVSGNGFPPLPEGLRHFNKWEAVQIPGSARILDLPDVHVPYHDERALSLAIEHGVQYEATHVLLSGDFCDFFSVSRWEKDPRKRNLVRENEISLQVLQYIRAKFPDAEIIFKLGNHEERWDRYLWLKSPELYGMPQLKLENILKFDENRITMIGDMRPIQAGELFIVHGHEFRWGISNPVNPARGYYLRAKENVLGHHLHQTSSHSEKSLAEDVKSAWSTGCLCDLHPDYAPINKWNHGFATVTTEENGYFEVHNYKIIEGRIFEG